jgi:hypothetical protein
VATNFYLHNFPANQITQEQLLVEDLVIEALQWAGMDVYYLPVSSRSESEIDYLFGDHQLKEYRRAYPIEMYLENVTGMDGEGDFISKFGLEIRDELSFLVSRRRFKQSTAGTNLIRPREGDLIYVPLTQNFFEINFVEHENDQAMFYTLGRGRGGNVYVYALKLKQHVFSNEIIQTGIESIDEQIRDHYPKTKITLTSGTSRFDNEEIVFQGPDLSNATAQAIVYDSSYSSDENFVRIIRPIGTFVSGPITGSNSGAVWQTSIISNFVEMDNAFEDIIDNNRIQQESDGILDWTEKNPFGET